MRTTDQEPSQAHAVSRAPGGKVRFDGFSSFLAQYGLVVGGLGVARLLNFVGALILARRMDVASFGSFSVGYAFAMLVGQLPNVLDVAFVRNHGKATNEPERRALERSHVQVKVASSLIVLGTAPLLSQLLANQLLQKQDLYPVILLALVDAAVFSLVGTGPAHFQARSRYGWYASLYVLEAALGVVAVLAYVVLTEPSAAGAMACYVIADGVLAATVIFTLLLRTRGSEAKAVRSGSMRLLRFSGWLAGATVVYLFVQRVDVMLLGRFADLSTLGQYGGALRLVAIVSLLTGNLSAVFAPRAARATESRKQIRDYVQQAWLASAAIAGVALIGAGVAAIVVRLALGPHYEGAVAPLRILLVAYLFVAISSPMSSLLIGFGRTKRVLMQRVLELFTALAVGLALIPSLSAIGAALSLLAAYAVGAVFATVNALRIVPSGSEAGA